MTPCLNHQFRGAVKIVLVGYFFSRREDIVDFVPHVNVVAISLKGIRNHMAAAFQPDIPQKPIKIAQGCILWLFSIINVLPAGGNINHGSGDSGALIANKKSFLWLLTHRS